MSPVMQITALVALVFGGIPVTQTQEARSTPSGTVSARVPFAGVWAPRDPDTSSKLFDLGLVTVPGDGRLTITQDGQTVTLASSAPPEHLTPRMAIGGELNMTSVYYLDGTVSRTRGAGLSDVVNHAQFDGNRLSVTITPSSGAARQVIYTLAGDDLRVEERRGAGDARVLFYRNVPAESSPLSGDWTIVFANQPTVTFALHFEVRGQSITGWELGREGRRSIVGTAANGQIRWQSATQTANDVWQSFAVAELRNGRVIGDSTAWSHDSDGKPFSKSCSFVATRR